MKPRCSWHGDHHHLAEFKMFAGGGTSKIKSNFSAFFVVVLAVKCYC